MELIRQWILGITCAAMILALAECLTPAGSAKKAGRLAGGLLLLLAVLKPLMSLDYDTLAQVLSEERISTSDYADTLNLENDRLVKAIIEEETAAYISDKAGELGVDCEAEVIYHYGEDGQAWPTAVTIRGSLDSGQKKKLSDFLEAELAIPEENQTFEEVMNQ